MQVLFNPTNEELKAQHQGVDVILAPYPEDGHVLKVDDKRARHILNILSPRGLTTLEYGDDRDDGAKKKEKAASGRQRNKDFKRKQIINFNQINHENKIGNRNYMAPTQQLKDYAAEMGIKLEQPYAPPDEGSEKISKLIKEAGEKDITIEEQGEQMSELQTQVSDLSIQLSSLIKMIKQPEKVDSPKSVADDGKWTEPVEDGDAKQTKEMVKFRTLNVPQFKSWLKKNWDDIPNYPDEIRNEIDVRHIKLLGVPLPDSLPE